jgi:mono/diheme cytochrome c family protein
MRRSHLLLTLASGLALALAGTPAQAKLPWVKKAQGMGFAEIKNCASCHSSEKPKKGEPMADRGKFLMDLKEKNKAKEVDLAWLKDYKGK